jgi:uncharacterized protein YkwD
VLRGAPDPDILFVTISLLGVALAASLAAPQTLPLTTASSAVTGLNGNGRMAAHAVADRATDVNLMLAALNARRNATGLAPLQLDPSLCDVAYEHAADMAVRKYFDHNTPEGVTPFQRMDRAHVRYGYAGENMALDQSTRAAELALWQSPEHRDNILQPHYAKVGIAAVSSTDGLIFVEDFSD